MTSTKITSFQIQMKPNISLRLKKFNDKLYKITANDLARFRSICFYSISGRLSGSIRTKVKQWWNKFAYDYLNKINVKQLVKTNLVEIGLVLCKQLFNPDSEKSLVLEKVFDYLKKSTIDKNICKRVQLNTSLKVSNEHNHHLRSSILSLNRS